MSFIKDDEDREFVKATIGAIIKGNKLDQNLVLCGPGPCGKWGCTSLQKEMLDEQDYVLEKMMDGVQIMCSEFVDVVPFGFMGSWVAEFANVL